MDIVIVDGVPQEVDGLSEVFPTVELPIEEIVVPQIVEQDWFVYEQTNEVGCISRIQTGVIIEEVVDEFGEVIEEKRIEAIPPVLTEPLPTISERIDTLEETQTKVVDTLAEALGVLL